MAMSGTALIGTSVLPSVTEPVYSNFAGFLPACLQGDHPAATGGILAHRPVLHRRRLADHWSKSAHTGPRATFSAVFVTGQKRGRILPSRKPVFWAFRDVTPPWPPSILSGQAGLAHQFT